MRLKSGAARPDTTGMIQPARFPRALRVGGLRVLHVALNSPVVAHESLPRGPAAAAIALDAHGAVLCVRSVRGGRRAFFASGAELAATPQLALDAALAFAERLGFLFDDDEVARRGGEAALRLWEDLCGDAVAAPAPFDADDLELEAGDDDPWPGDLIGSVAPEAHALSKFRLFSERA
jgi:hypothetical protein